MESELSVDCEVAEDFDEAEDFEVALGSTTLRGVAVSLVDCFLLDEVGSAFVEVSCADEDSPPAVAFWVESLPDNVVEWDPVFDGAPESDFVSVLDDVVDEESPPDGLVVLSSDFFFESPADFSAPDFDFLVSDFLESELFESLLEL